jgi:hypothetical protein
VKKLTGLLLIISLLGCKAQIKFNKEQWAEFYIDNNYRESMLTDLTYNYNLKGINYQSLVALLDSPQFEDSLKATYEIYTDYDIIDPWGGEQLVFYLNKDSIVTDYKIKKWSNGRKKWWMWH